MPVITDLLKDLKSDKNRENKELFFGVIEKIGEVCDKTGPDLSSAPGRASRAEAALCDKVFWMRTLPLEDGNTFMALHPEVCVGCGKGKERTGGVMGLWYGARTTEPAVIKVKTGAAGDHLLYSAAEGIASVASLWSGLEEQKKLWKKSYPEDFEKYWHRSDPFNELNAAQARLVILGNSAWVAKNAERYINLLPETFQAGGLHIEASVYSLDEPPRKRIRPHMLLNMKKIHPLKKHILDAMADIYAGRF